ncbi:hypothetical protein ES703_61641 [subsurface metagenome]
MKDINPNLMDVEFIGLKIVMVIITVLIDILASVVFVV